MDFTKGRRNTDGNSPLSERKPKLTDEKVHSSNKALLSDAKQNVGLSADASQDEGMVVMGDQDKISVEPHQPKYER